MTPNRSVKAILLITIVMLFAALPASAVAAAEFLWQTPADGKIGSGVEQLDHPNGIVADPDTGHLFIADSINGRVVELDAWGQFVKAWGWGVANGASEPQTCGPGASPPTVACLEGSSGSGPGQFGGSGPKGGMAIDSAGNLYVGDMANARVQKFDPAGNFMLMLGGGVNKGPNHPGNVCTATHLTEGDTCGAGAFGEGDGQFKGGFESDHIDKGPGGTIFVGDSSGRIQEFETNGAFKSKVTLAGELAGKDIYSLVVDGSGNFYVKVQGDNDHIFKLSPAGTALLSITVSLNVASPLALDANGNLYAIAETGKRREVVKFDSAGKVVVAPGEGFAVTEGSLELGGSGVVHGGLATNTVTADGATDVYVTATNVGTVSFAAAYGAPPDKWAAPLAAPEIVSQYAVSVDADAALLRAEINPRFWADTSYYVEYGTSKCSEGGCTTQQPLPPGRQLGAGVIAKPVTSKGIFLVDLSPDTTYHYRFVAQSSGGGPVHGVGLGETEGAFTTPSLPSAPNENCPNAERRSGLSAFLPDCRAYEMVSPVDKNGADIIGLCNLRCERTEINQASIDGEKFTYSSYKAFGDAISSPYVNQYLSSRGPEGWSTHGISPPYHSGITASDVVKPGIVFSFDHITDPEYKAFTPDLSDAWLVSSSNLPLTPDALAGWVNVYRQNIADGALTALTTSEPKFAPNQYYGVEFVGRTADGTHALVTAQAALTPGAATGGENQLYDFTDGEVHLVSVLPDGTPNPGASYAGTRGNGQATHGYQMLNHAISDDASRIFWTDGGNEGKVYVRLNPDQPQSALSPAGKCTQPAKACTFAVSDGLAQFLTATPDGSKALYKENQNLYEFDVGAKTKTLIAGGVPGMLGTSEDLSHIYFVSGEVLAPGAGAGGGLYLRQGGTLSYIAPLSNDITLSGASNIDPRPARHVARVTPDGRQIAFVSTESLTGYDNTDAVNGKADSEIFTYDADSGQLSCVSCNPTGARPHGDELKAPYTFKGAAGFNTGAWGAAWLNTSETSLYTPNVLSEDGNRLFFNSFDALVPHDTNGVQDVYQWERAGSADCSVDSPDFSPPNDGCVSLISSGTSPQLSEFVDATPDGSDVFFKTTASLDPRDPGLIDVYDARVGGGFSPPPIPPAPCVGDACQSVPAPPNDSTPASASFRGAGDPAPTKPRRRSCSARKGKAAASKRGAGRKQGKKRCQRANRRAGR